MANPIDKNQLKDAWTSMSAAFKKFPRERMVEIVASYNRQQLPPALFLRACRLYIDEATFAPAPGEINAVARRLLFEQQTHKQKEEHKVPDQGPSTPLGAMAMGLLHYYLLKKRGKQPLIDFKRQYPTAPHSDEEAEWMTDWLHQARTIAQDRKAQGPARKRTLEIPEHLQRRGYPKTYTVAPCTYQCLACRDTGTRMYWYDPTKLPQNRLRYSEDEYFERPLDAKPTWHRASMACECQADTESLMIGVPTHANAKLVS